MRRKILMVLLAVGAVGGYAEGFAEMHACHHDRRSAFERHVAEVCIDAANHAKNAPLE